MQKSVTVKSGQKKWYLSCWPILTAILHPPILKPYLGRSGQNIIAREWAYMHQKDI